MYVSSYILIHNIYLFLAFFSICLSQSLSPCPSPVLLPLSIFLPFSLSSSICFSVSVNRIAIFYFSAQLTKSSKGESLWPEHLATFLIFLNLFIHYILLLAVLGLSCCAQAFTSYVKWELLSRYAVQASHWNDFSCCRAQALGSWASVVAEHRVSCPVSCGIFPDQGSNMCPLNWQANSTGPWEKS